MSEKHDTESRFPVSKQKGRIPATGAVRASHSFSKNRAMQHLTRVVSFTSGKGGVGKTQIVVNVALALAERGKSVLMLDADLGLANVDVLLDIRPRYTLADMFAGTRTIEDIIVDGPLGISLIPAASGVESMLALSPTQRSQLLAAVEQVASRYDYLLIDTSAGIGSDVLYFNSASSEVVCVITDEPTSLTDAYALIKLLANRYGEKRVCIAVNNVASEADAQKAFGRLERAVGQFLGVALDYLGFVPKDAAVGAAVQAQRAVLEIFPSSAAGRGMNALAERIDSDGWEYRVKGGVQLFFEQLLEVTAHG